MVRLAKTVYYNQQKFYRKDEKLTKSIAKGELKTLGVWLATIIARGEETIKQETQVFTSEEITNLKVMQENLKNISDRIYVPTEVMAILATEELIKNPQGFQRAMVSLVRHCPRDDIKLLLWSMKRADAIIDI